MKMIAVAVGVGVLACATAPAAGARPFKQYWFRVSHYELDVTSTTAGSETQGSRTTSGSVTRTGTIDYHGRRGDLAFFTELPRRGYPGNISISRLVPFSIHQSGNWSKTYDDGTTDSGTCHGDKVVRPFEPYSQINRGATTLSGQFESPIADDSFDDGCALDAGFDSPHFPWKLPTSAFRRRVVKIKLSHDDVQPGDIHSEIHWTGTVTLRRLKVCRTNACVRSVR